MAHRVCCDAFRCMDRVCCDEPARLTVSVVMQDRVCCDDFRSSTTRKSLRGNEIVGLEPVPIRRHSRRQE